MRSAEHRAKVCPCRASHAASHSLRARAAKRPVSRANCSNSVRQITAAAAPLRFFSCSEPAESLPQRKSSAGASRALPGATFRRWAAPSLCHRRGSMGARVRCSAALSIARCRHSYSVGCSRLRGRPSSGCGRPRRARASQRTRTQCGELHPNPFGKPCDRTNTVCPKAARRGADVRESESRKTKRARTAAQSHRCVVVAIGDQNQRRSDKISR